MKNRMLDNNSLNSYINDLVLSVFRARDEKKETEMLSWPLFFSELTLHDCDFYDYDTGALAIAISVLANCDKNNTEIKETVSKACKSLKSLKNNDHSWSSVADLTELQRTGCIYNTAASIEALIDAGEFDLSTSLPANIIVSVESVKKNIEWLYSQKIKVKDSNLYGWGYTGEAEGIIYIMPTIQVLLVLKKLYYSIAKSYPQLLNDSFVDGKLLIDIIDEIQQSVYSFRVSPEKGWGKTLDDSSDHIIYTLHSLYALNYSTFDKPVSNLKQPKKILTEKDVVFFTDLLCTWLRKGYFNPNYLDALGAEEYFDSFIECRYIDNGRNYKYINNHESFFEPLAIRAIITFVKNNLKVIKKHKQGKIYDIIVKLHNSLVHRIRSISINNEKYTVVLSRRGLPSQSYPIYAIVQSVEALCLLRDNKKMLFSLMKYREWFIRLVAFIIQVVALYGVNYYTLVDVEKYKIAIVSIIAPISEYIKNWVIGFSKVEE